MWPWGHLAVGYFCYLAIVRLGARRGLTAATLLAVAFGTQFPDLVDKPLAWSVPILPSGRSLAHSLVVAAVLLTVLYWISRVYEREEIVLAFAVGYVAHSLSDLGPGTVLGLLQGDLSQLTWTTYLVWPLLAPPPYPNDSSFISHFVAFAFEPYVVFQSLLFVAAFGHWILKGQPGLRTTLYYLDPR
ncbi:metal-dependent hydrolase [Haloarcula nitratireducens]|uniref:Metal-dependent hydrolase n=1 Tax=Haloarcula nitratireducens TaxID=2487749 RepID=A0AAW4PGC2_9EURY|nr:metal-dependent hydrolase [Halomicroarcula nitratireducens]MBX0296668.1 metal-dependent hydrolase [Halomicroarcula nitratireducens]